MKQYQCTQSCITCKHKIGSTEILEINFFWLISSDSCHNVVGISDYSLLMQLVFSLPSYSKFLVYSCLLLFAFLFALRLDGTINCTYWWIFLPLWLWKGLVISGAVVAGYVWWRHPEFRLVTKLKILGNHVFQLFYVFAFLFAPRNRIF